MQIITDNISPANLGQKLKKIFDEKGITQPAIALYTGINQSQISRIFNGDFRRLYGKNVRELCKYANIVIKKNQKSPQDPRKSNLLMNALGDVWDGSKQKERALAKLIRTLEPLVKN